MCIWSQGRLIVGFKMKQNCCLNCTRPSRCSVSVRFSEQLAESEGMRAEVRDCTALWKSAVHTEPPKMLDASSHWLTSTIKEGQKGYTYNKGWGKSKEQRLGKKKIKEKMWTQETKRKSKNPDCCRFHCLLFLRKNALLGRWRTTTLDHKQRRLGCDPPSYLPSPPEPQLVSASSKDHLAFLHLQPSEAP